MRHLFLLFVLLLPLTSPTPAVPALDMAAASRPRVIVSTDIGGTDPDDLQSMVHFLLYADMFDVEALISSPYGPGRREHILEVIERYELDYANLKAHSPGYPTPAALRAITWEGAIDSAGAAGFDKPTDGSRRIVESARRADPRPLYVLVWGGIDDLAQALHDAPEILPKLRVYFIGGPNKMWSVNAYNYIEQHHPRLWMIEANSTYRGWFTGGNQSGEWGNRAFVAEHVAGRGALGEMFATLLNGTVKMGDSPSVAYLLHRTPDDPSQPGWGGKFVRAWDGRKAIFDRLTTASDSAEIYGVVEFALPVPAGMTARNSAQMIFDGRIPAPATVEGGVLRFRFSPRDAKVWSYVIKSDVPGLDGRSGQFTAAPPPPGRFKRPSARHPNWWIDDQDPAAAEGVHPGAKNVSRWREEFLRDFAKRMDRTGPRVARVVPKDAQQQKRSQICGTAYAPCPAGGQDEADDTHPGTRHPRSVRRIPNGSHTSCHTPAAADCVGAAAGEPACAAALTCTYSCTDADACADANTATRADANTATRAGATSEDDPPRHRDVIALVSWRDFRLA